MLSKEKLLEAVDVHVAELLAEQVYSKVKADLQERWDTVLAELAYSRKTSERLSATLTQSQQYNVRLEQVLSEKEAELKRSREVQRKQAEILSEALELLGAGE